MKTWLLPVYIALAPERENAENAACFSEQCENWEFLDETMLMPLPRHINSNGYMKNTHYLSIFLQ